MNEIQELYKGTIKLKFIDSNHSYWVSKKEKSGWTDFERISGVTTFIGIKDKSAPMKYWVARIMHNFCAAILQEREITKFDLKEAKELHTKRLQEASNIGTKIHDWISEYLLGKEPSMPQETVVLQGANAFLDWQKENKLKFIASEIALYSKEHGFCGKLDAVAKQGKKTYLIDFKTSNGIYNEVMLQTAAYAHAHEEMGLGKIDGRFELRLEKRTPEEFELEMDEKGKVNEVYKPFEALELPGNQDEDFAGFLAAKNLFEWNKKAEKILKEKLAS